VIGQRNIPVKTVESLMMPHSDMYLTLKTGLYGVEQC